MAANPILRTRLPEYSFAFENFAIVLIIYCNFFAAVRAPELDAVLLIYFPLIGCISCCIRSLLWPMDWNQSVVSHFKISALLSESNNFHLQRFLAFLSYTLLFICGEETIRDGIFFCAGCSIACLALYLLIDEEEDDMDEEDNDIDEWVLDMGLGDACEDTKGKGASEGAPKFDRMMDMSDLDDEFEKMEKEHDEDCRRVEEKLKNLKDEYTELCQKWERKNNALLRKFQLKH